MAFNFRERRISGASTNNPPTYVREYVATGETSGFVVKSYAYSATPNVVATADGILYRQDVRVDQAGWDTYYVSVPYGQLKRIAGQYVLSFDTTGGTVHMSHSRQTIASYGTSPPNFKQLMGVNNDFVEGADAIVPALKINVAFRHPTASLTLPQIKYLASITGTVNSATFLTFAAGEVLFLGCSGTEGTDTETEVQYQFACAANQTGLSIGDVSSIAKKATSIYGFATKTRLTPRTS